MYKLTEKYIMPLFKSARAFCKSYVVKYPKVDKDLGFSSRINFLHLSEVRDLLRYFQNKLTWVRAGAIWMRVPQPQWKGFGSLICILHLPRMFDICSNSLWIRRVWSASELIKYQERRTYFEKSQSEMNSKFCMLFSQRNGFSKLKIL